MKSITLMISFYTLITITPSLFANECLEEASNEDLVSELERRIGSGRNNGGALAETICYGDRMRIGLISSNAEEFSIEFSFRFQSDCDQYSNQIGNTFRVNTLKIAALCQGSTLRRIALTPRNLRQLESIEYRFQSDCEVKAREINAN